MTPQQHVVLVYVHERISGTGVCPTLDEIAAHMGIRNRSNVHRLLSVLEADGHIRRRPHGARAIEVLRPPPGTLGPAEIAWCNANADLVRGLIARAPG